MVICCFIYTILRFVMVYESEREQLLYSCSFFFYLFQNGGFRKQLELKKFKLFFLCIMHKEEGEENDKPRVVQSKQKEIM